MPEDRIAVGGSLAGYTGDIRLFRIYSPVDIGESILSVPVRKSPLSAIGQRHTMARILVMDPPGNSMIYRRLSRGRFWLVLYVARNTSSTESECISRNLI